MLIEHPELQARLNQVLGGPGVGRVCVLSLKLYAQSAAVEVKISFEEGNVPANFRKKSKNCLVLFLDIPDFTLGIRLSDEAVLGGEVQFIRSNGLMFYMGRYQYQISAKAVYIGSLQSVNEMDLIDQVL
ncbi:hypothetical protein ACVNHC_18920 [Pannonibacter sp. Q-1]